MGPGDRGEHHAGRTGQDQRGKPVAGAGQAGGPVQGQRGDRAPGHQHDRRAERRGELEAQQRAVQRLVADRGDVAQPAHVRNLGRPEPPRVGGQREPGQRAAPRKRRRGQHGGPSATGEPEQRNEDQRGQLDRRGQADEQPLPPAPPQRQQVDRDQGGKEEADLAVLQIRGDRRRQHQEQGVRRGGPPAQQQREGGDGDDRGQRPGELQRHGGCAGEREEDQARERGVGEGGVAGADEVVQARAVGQPLHRSGVDGQVGEADVGRAGEHGPGGDQRGQRGGQPQQRGAQAASPGGGRRDRAGETVRATTRRPVRLDEARAL